ncbi:MAG: AAA family ATPase [Deltaproteobacteria bacterium]|nr:AAA family ATPase [Deltaproteobacteria bacterium]
MTLFDQVKTIIDRESSSHATDEVREGETPQATSIVPGFISPGVTVMVAEPKMGMPILGLGLALEVARGGKVFGTEVKAQQVLYLAPKATEPRTRERLKKMLQGADCPVRLEMVFKSMHLDEPGFEELEARLTANPETRLVFIEMYRSRKQRPDEAGQEQFSRLKSIATSYQIALVVVHHPQQAGLADFFDPASGSTRMIVAIDTFAILDRRPYQRGATLSILGRNRKRLELALNKTTGGWEGPSPGRESRLTQARQEIVTLFREKPGVWRHQAIVEELGKSKTNVANLLTQLRKQGIIRKPYHGHYCLMDYSHKPWQVEGRISKKRQRMMTPEELDAAIDRLSAKISKDIESLCDENFQ